MNPLSALQCPSCSSPLQATDLDVGRGLARCAHCGVLVTLPEPAASAGGKGGGDSAWRARPDVPLPSGIRVERTPDGSEIRRRWFTPVALFLVFFCVAWDGFLVFWYTMAFTQGAPWIAKVFPILHLAVGVGLTYWTIASLFNTTRIQLTRREMVIRHGPVPWAGNRAVPRSEIDQLYCLRKEHRGKYGPTFSFEVWLKRRKGEAQKLLGAGLTEQQALAIEQQIERGLGIPDRPVPGEIAR